MVDTPTATPTATPADECDCGAGENMRTGDPAVVVAGNPGDSVRLAVGGAAAACLEMGRGGKPEEEGATVA